MYKLCLGVPARIINVFEKDGLRIAKVILGGIARDVIVVTNEDLEEGDYVIVHAGMAISKIDENELETILNIWRELEQVIIEN